jgi:hypothetical protein
VAAPVRPASSSATPSVGGATTLHARGLLAEDGPDTCSPALDRWQFFRVYPLDGWQEKDRLTFVDGATLPR